MHIRSLTKADMKEAVRLKIACWTEELAGKADNTLDVEKEYAFWCEWMQSGKKHHDQRTLLGVFEHDRMQGVIFASLAAEDDAFEACEINGLYVYPEARGKGIALAMIRQIIQVYLGMGCKELIVYCHHHAPAQVFYTRLGGKVIRQDAQMDGKLLVDIFSFDQKTLSALLSRREKEDL